MVVMVIECHELSGRLSNQILRANGYHNAGIATWL
jgi:hypothetical protein